MVEKVTVEPEETDVTLLNALIRAHRWNRWLNKGKYLNGNQIADEEGIISPSYASRVLRLILLVPDIQEKILHSTHPATLTLAEPMESSRFVPGSLGSRRSMKLTCRHQKNLPTPMLK